MCIEKSLFLKNFPIQKPYHVVFTPVPNLRSPIWQHFTPLDAANKVRCLHCPQQLSVSNKSTCSLLRHMAKKHPAVEVHLHHNVIQRQPSTEHGQKMVVNTVDLDGPLESPHATFVEYEIEETDTEENSNNGPSSSSRIVTTSRKHSDDNIKSSKDSVTNAMTEATKQISEAVISLKGYMNKRRINDEDEYDHFGHIIAAKVRKIQNEEKREMVMHSVYNVVYAALMKNV